MTQPTAPAHCDNLLGICNAIGEDWGFDPLVLRLALAVTLLLDYRLALAAYAICGIAVLVSRVLTRAPRLSAAAPARPPVARPIAPVLAARSTERVPELVG